MKKINIIFLVLTVVCSFLLVNACLNPVFTEPVITASVIDLPEGMGGLTLSINGGQAGRTLLPTVPISTSFTQYILSFTKGEETLTLDPRDNETLEDTIFLDIGTYELVVEAFIGTTPNFALAARGEANVIIGPTVDNECEVDLKPIRDTGTQGIFSWNFSFGETPDTALMTVTPRGGSAMPAIDIKATPVSTTPLNVGFYNVEINITKVNVEPIVIHEILHVYTNLTSEFPLTITSAHFNNIRYDVTFVGYNHPIMRLLQLSTANM